MNTEQIKKAGIEFIENTMKYSFNMIGERIIANRLLKCVEFGAELKSKMETRVYVVDGNDERVYGIDVNKFTDEEFMFEAEQQGRVLTLPVFAESINNNPGFLYLGVDVIRFIEVPVFE